jgi:hydrogenase expression/formation protein HypE
LLTHRLLRDHVFALLSNPQLDRQHDGAMLTVPSRIAFTTDSYVVSPVFFPGGNIGDLAVNGTLNDLAMCGAIPQYLSLAFILEEGFPMEQFHEIIRTIKSACERAGVEVVTGDTKVVEKGKGDGIFINTSGIGMVHSKAAIDSKRIQPGDQILISGPIAEHGVAILSKRKGLEFESTIQSDTRALHFAVRELLDACGESVHFLRDPTRGGVATVLNEAATSSGQGIQLVQAQLPVSSAVEGACEMLGLDPLYVANEGVFIAFVDPLVTDVALETLRSNPATKDATRIGTVVSDHQGKVVLKSVTGGRRVLNMLTGEQLPRIC